MLEFISECWRQYSNLTLEFMLLLRTVLLTGLLGSIFIWVIVLLVRLTGTLHLNIEKNCKHFMQKIFIYPFHLKVVQSSSAYKSKTNLGNENVEVNSAQPFTQELSLSPST